MLNEKRAEVRQAVNRLARLQESPITRVRDCTVRDISGNGVRVVIPGGMASNQFTLFLSDRAADERRCVVIWRLGDLVGARFEK